MTGGVRWGNLRGMGDAAKVIDWNGTDIPANLGDLLTGLPPGRYRLEVVPVVDAGDVPGGFTLTPEADAKVQAGIRSARAGRVVSFDELDARLEETLARGAAR